MVGWAFSWWKMTFSVSKSEVSSIWLPSGAAVLCRSDLHSRRIMLVCHKVLLIMHYSMSKVPQLHCQQYWSIEPSLHPLLKAALIELKHTTFPKKGSSRPCILWRSCWWHFSWTGHFLPWIHGSWGSSECIPLHCTVFWHKEEAVWMKHPGLSERKWFCDSAAPL